MKRVSRAGLKIELLVPASRLFILRVHNERANSRNIGGLRGPQQGIFKKGSSDSGALLGAINCQSGEYHHRDCMPGKPFPRPFARLFQRDRTDR
jgi:hypothetical protein